MSSRSPEREKTLMRFGFIVQAHHVPWTLSEAGELVARPNWIQLWTRLVLSTRERKETMVLALLGRPGSLYLGSQSRWGRADG